MRIGLIHNPYCHSQHTHCRLLFTVKHSKAGFQTSSHPQNSASHLLGLQGLHQIPAGTTDGKKDTLPKLQKISELFACAYLPLNKKVQDSFEFLQYFGCHTCTSITRRLYIYSPIFEDYFFVFKEGAVLISQWDFLCSDRSNLNLMR